MSDKIAFKPSVRHSWTPCVPRSVGVCFTISWDRLQQILQGVLVKNVVSQLAPGESIERVEVDEQGIVVYIA